MNTKGAIKDIKLPPKNTFEDNCTPLANGSATLGNKNITAVEPISLAIIVKRLNPEQIQELIDDLQEHLRLIDSDHPFL